MSPVASYSALGRAAMISAGRLAVSSRKPAAAATATSTVARRFLSSTPQRGGGFFQRIGAFFTGAGIGCGIGYFYLAKEISGSTAALERAIEKSHKDLSDRVAKLERR